MRLDESQVAAINRFPDQNPNPVLRMSRDGVLLYANPASAPMTHAWEVGVGERLPEDVRIALIGAARAGYSGVEINAIGRIFAVKVVSDLDFFNIYGTDITAAKLIDRFPGDNPNPVMRVGMDWRLLYANQASRPIVSGLGLQIGEAIPDELAAQLRIQLRGGAPSEVRADGRTYQLVPVALPEFGFTNVYGTDVTARIAMNRFPDQNPNPVLRVTHDGRLAYANPASRFVREALGAEVGQQLSSETMARIAAEAAKPDGGTMEVSAAGRVYEVLVIAVFEFAFINLYGTDVTAAREVERANADNERLLLNILPASIADRLRGGETVIADRFDEMTVLFADVVDFTPLSVRLSADDLVALLNAIFRHFDGLADRYRLEKIKTIGDAYMVAGGFTGDAPDHPSRVVEMGLAMLDAMAAIAQETGYPLAIRVGLHVGPAVAGVIGVKKFIYDVWGDTVNTASRMESHGVPGRIQVTATTASRLADGYEFEPRGVIDVKGKGPTETALLIGRRK